MSYRKPTPAMVAKAQREHAALVARIEATYRAILSATPHLGTECMSDIRARAPEALNAAYEAAHEARDAFERDCIDRGLGWRSFGSSLLYWY